MQHARLFKSFFVLLLLCFHCPSFSADEEQPQGDPEVDAAIKRGVDFLVSKQHADGSWGESSEGRSYEVFAPVPGAHYAFRSATTALCVMALEHSGIDEEPVREAKHKGLEYLVKHARVKRATPRALYNVWSFGYGLRCFAEMIHSGKFPEMEASMRAEAEELVKALEIYQVPDGGWGYYDFEVQSYRPSGPSVSFMTATVVISLYGARQVGIEVPEPMLQKALTYLNRCRKEDGSYLYGMYLQYTNHEVNKIKGSVCRTSACHLAQYLFTDRVSIDDLVKGIKDLIEQHRFVDAARKRPIPHEGWYSNSGYFYLYGQFYASMVLHYLSREDQDRFWPVLRKMILRLQEPGGYWSDYPMYGYHKYYGTAYAVSALSWSRRDMELYAKK